MLNPQPSSGFDNILPGLHGAMWDGIYPKLEEACFNNPYRSLPIVEFQAHEVSPDAGLTSNATFSERSGFAEQLTGGCWRFEISSPARNLLFTSACDVDPAPCLITLKPSLAQVDEWLRTDVVPLLIYPSGAIRSFAATIGLRLNTNGPANITVQTSDVLSLLDPDGPAGDEVAPLKLTLVLWRNSYRETAHAA